MKRIIGASLAMLVAVSAPSGARETVGRWTIQGDGGTCSAATTLAGVYTLVIFAKPPGGENNGGLMFGRPGDWSVADGPTVIELVGKGSLKGKHEAYGYADLDGYFLPFATVSELDKYPDTWQLKAIKDGQPLIDQPVTQYKAAAAKLDACAGKPG